MMNKIKIFYLLTFLGSCMTSFAQDHNHEHDDVVKVNQLSQTDLAVRSNVDLQEGKSTFGFSLTNQTQEAWQNVTLVCKFSDSSVYLPETFQLSSDLNKTSVLGNVFGPQYLELTLDSMLVGQAVEIRFSCSETDEVQNSMSWYLQYTEENVLHETHVYLYTNEIKY